MADEHARIGGPELYIDGVLVGEPVTEGQARALASAGVLADDGDGLVAAWDRVAAMWSVTVERARGRPDTDHGRRVDGEWSLVETLRHLVFVTDTWVGGGVLGDEGHHPLGLPPHFIAHVDGLDRDADPSLVDILAVRADKQAFVREAISRSGDALGQLCHGRLSAFTALGALQVTMTEELAHHSFATRDLAALA